MSRAPAGRLHDTSEANERRERIMAAEPKTVSFDTTVAVSGNNTGMVVPDEAIEQLAVGN